ncbi:MAG: hypothetical protein DBY45_08805 [Clostridiales bacterium]|nr:MAG: hypothetical protein DBY45_08805 [Clostridiales bacterium]
MTGTERISHMKEQMRPSEELVARVREQVSVEPSVSPAKLAWIPRAAVVCAAALIVAGAWALPRINPGLNSGIDTNGPSSGGAVTSGFSETGADIEENNASQIQNGIYIPQIVLEEPEPGVAVDMVGLIVYRGSIYTWTNNLTLSNAQEQALRGEYLGRTKGNIDEWSKQDDYSKELASSIGKEDVYTVCGYDRDFRIMTSDGQGNVGIYERLNDIWLESGNDLFGRMKLKGNLEAFCWQPLSEWDSGVENRYDPGLSEEVVNAFIDGLYDAVYMEKADWRQLEPKPCYLTLKDGTEIRLMLLKGGYVKYLGMGGNGVFRMEESVFNEVYEDALI